jgi:hypothetical protein
MLPTSTPIADEPDTGFGQPVMEEMEAMADAAAQAAPKPD